ncbi:hypothetical protein [Neorhizobium sp. T25_13]|uniref:hypothetical protein n=1 Tax=Neorhizobium sp. T25_13 TaxID=2093830 RepID=UPI00155E5CFA|nr:hypothetical protein [Neorhizobium sp. T25_13]
MADDRDRSEENAVIEGAEPEEAEPALTVKEFLESTHPSVAKQVKGLWRAARYIHSGSAHRKVEWPDLRLHCVGCEGERTFRSDSNGDFRQDSEDVDTHPDYTCGDCHNEMKRFALYAVFSDDGGGTLYKYGELPPFGIPVPNRVLRLFGGEDAKTFLKGRQCEDLGYGIGAFAYYRRVVENHRNDLFDEIIKVCRTVAAPKELIDQLDAAKGEISFSKSLEKIKTALPQGLLINGHNPLNALHGALSIGIHTETDAECLAAAQAVRLVLSDLVEKIAMLKQDNKQLNDAVQLLLSKR